MTTPGFDAIANFRDVGGHRTADGSTVRRGRLYRSGHLGAASEADVDRLRAMGVRTVVDFRGPADVELDGEDRLPDGARHVSLPMWDPGRLADLREALASPDGAALQERFGDGKARQIMVEGAARMITSPTRTEGYRTMMRHLADGETYPAILHCTAGKDRTGWAASVVLLALDVPRAAIVDHYLESNAHRRPDPDRSARLEAAGLAPDLLTPFSVVTEEYIETMFATVDDHWGGVDAYLRDALDVDDDRRAHLRQELLEDV